MLMCTDRPVMRAHVLTEPGMMGDVLQVNTRSAVRATSATARESAGDTLKMSLYQEAVNPVVATTNPCARNPLVQKDVNLDVNVV